MVAAGNTAGGIVRIVGFSLLLALCGAVSSGAFAQQVKFDPTQCEGRSAQDCNALMGSLQVPPQQREKVLLLRATALLQKHDLEGSIAEYREMTVVDSRSLVAYSTLGFLESIGEKWTDAEADLKHAVEIAPDQGRLRAMLAIALAKNGDCNAAADTLAEAKKAPDAPSIGPAEQAVAIACP